MNGLGCPQQNHLAASSSRATTAGSLLARFEYVQPQLWWLLLDWRTSSHIAVTASLSRVVQPDHSLHTRRVPKSSHPRFADRLIDRYGESDNQIYSRSKETSSPIARTTGCDPIEVSFTRVPASRAC